MESLGSLTLILLLAFLAEGLTEYFARPFLKNTPHDVRGAAADAATAAGETARAEGVAGEVPPPPPLVLSPMWLRYVAACVGIMLALLYDIDLLRLFGFHAVLPYAGCILTGILIGRGSNYMHDLVDRYFAPIPKPLDWH